MVLEDSRLWPLWKRWRWFHMGGSEASQVGKAPRVKMVPVVCKWSIWLVFATALRSKGAYCLLAIVFLFLFIFLPFLWCSSLLLYMPLAMWKNIYGWTLLDYNTEERISCRAASIDSSNHEFVCWHRHSDYWSTLKREFENNVSKNVRKWRMGLSTGPLETWATRFSLFKH